MRPTVGLSSHPMLGKLAVVASRSTHIFTCSSNIRTWPAHTHAVGAGGCLKTFSSPHTVSCGYFLRVERIRVLSEGRRFLTLPCAVEMKCGELETMSVDISINIALTYHRPTPATVDAWKYDRPRYPTNTPFFSSSRLFNGYLLLLPTLGADSLFVSRQPSLSIYLSPCRTVDQVSQFQVTHTHIRIRVTGTCAGISFSAAQARADAGGGGGQRVKYKEGWTHPSLVRSR